MIIRPNVLAATDMEKEASNSSDGGNFEAWDSHRKAGKNWPEWKAIGESGRGLGEFERY